MCEVEKKTGSILTVCVKSLTVSVKSRTRSKKRMTTEVAAPDLPLSLKTRSEKLGDGLSWTSGIKGIPLYYHPVLSSASLTRVGLFHELLAVKIDSTCLFRCRSTPNLQQVSNPLLFLPCTLVSWTCPVGPYHQYFLKQTAEEALLNCETLHAISAVENNSQKFLHLK